LGMRKDYVCDSKRRRRKRIDDRVWLALVLAPIPVAALGHLIRSATSRASDLTTLEVGR
jgi:hypothetical protein